MHDFIDKLTSKRPSLSFKDWRPGDQKVYVLDIRKVEKKLGWTPTVSPEQGVKKLIKWVSENKHLFIK